MQERESNAGFKVQRIQFPLRLAYAVTINKSQGQTYDLVGVDLRQPVFAHGQLYVSVGRVRSFGSLKIRVHTVNEVQGKMTKKGVMGTFTKNKVIYGALTNCSHTRAPTAT